MPRKIGFADYYVETEELKSGRIHHTASAYLTFVALDEAFRPRPVPPLELADEVAVRRNREAMARRKIRLVERTQEKRCC